MKKITFILLFTASLITAKAQFVNAELQVSGLTCSMCSKAVDKALQTIPFIDKVEVDLEKTLYKLEFKKGAEVNPDLIAKKVKDAGFTVSKLIMWFDFQNVEVPENGHWTWKNSSFMAMSPVKKKLNGVLPITFVDFAFIPKKEFIQRLSSTKYHCYKSGKSEPCCPSDIAPKTRIFHVEL